MPENEEPNSATSQLGKAYTRFGAAADALSAAIQLFAKSNPTAGVIISTLNFATDVNVGSAAGGFSGLSPTNRFAVAYATASITALATAGLLAAAPAGAVGAVLVIGGAGAINLLTSTLLTNYIKDNNIDVVHASASSLQDLSNFVEAWVDEVHQAVDHAGDVAASGIENETAYAANFLDEIAFRMLGNPLLDKYSADVIALSDFVREAGDGVGGFFDDLWDALTGSGGGSGAGVPGGYGPNDPGGNRAMVSG